MTAAAPPASRATVPFEGQAAFKEAAATALVVFALTFFMVGLHASDVVGGLKIVTRFDQVILATLAAFVGRFALILLRRQRPWPVLAAGGLFAPLLGASLLGLLPFPLRLFDDAVVDGLLAVVAAILAARAGWMLIRQETAAAEETADRGAAAERAAAKVQRAAKVVGPLLLVLALILPFLPESLFFSMSTRQRLDIAILVTTYIMLGWGLNIVVGLAGLLDLGYVAFYAVGAYSYALLAQHFGLGFWICLPFAGIMAAFAGILLGFPVLRLRGDYLAIVTLGFGEMIRLVLLNWYTFTNGPSGISGIPRPTFFGLPFAPSPPEGGESFHSFFGLTYSPTDRIIFLYYLILGLALLTNAFTLRVRKLPVGRAWEALREDEIACRSLGINPRNTKLTAFAIGAMFAGFGGSFFATRQGFISPESFSFIESAVILAIVVLGGFGSQLGVVFAAILLIGLPEFFRELESYRMLAFGAAMVLIMLWRPEGLLAHREPTIRLHGRGAGGGGT